MREYRGYPIIHEYWIDYDLNLIFAIVEWEQLDSDEYKSNLILHTKEYHDD